ncbi:MAG TPA: alpha/beta fold hydrolase [Tepidisphaeraceae bacterium]|nr:alpha/beta fold hydrolase [Tepidisphaeraceae bacterium]
MACLIVCCLSGCADRLILFPPANAVAGPGVQRRTVQHGDNTIEIFTARSAGANDAEPRAFMLEFTGNMTRAEHIVAYVASRWGNRPVETWVINYPGYGKSTGGARLRNIPPAALAAYDELRRIAGDRPIFVAGQSLGSIAALYVASKRDVAGVIIQNPPLIPEQIWRQHGWWNLWLLAAPVAWQIPREMNSIISATQATARAVILIADSDRVAPPRFQWKIASAYAGEKRVIVQRNAGHQTHLDDADHARLREAMGWLFDRATAAE